MPLFNLDKMDHSKGQVARNDDLRNTIGDQSVVGDDVSGAEGGGEDVNEDEDEDGKGSDAEAAYPNWATSDEQPRRQSGFASWTPNKAEQEPASELV